MKSVASLTFRCLGFVVALISCAAALLQVHEIRTLLDLDVSPSSDNEVLAENEVLREENLRLGQQLQDSLRKEIDRLRVQREKVAVESPRGPTSWSTRPEHESPTGNLQLAQRYVIQGLQSLSNGAYHDALEYGLRAIEAEPRHVVAYSLRAVAYAYLGDDARAHAELARAEPYATDPATELALSVIHQQIDSMFGHAAQGRSFKLMG